MYSAKKDGRGMVYITQFAPTLHPPRLEVRNAELYDYWCPNAPKKPLLSTRAKEVFLLYHKIEYGIIISTTRDLRRNNMNENKNNKNSKKGNNSSGLAIGMCIGISIGTAIGAATHNIGLWMPIGLSAGLCLGIVLGHNSKDDNEDGTDDKQ